MTKYFLPPKRVADAEAARPGEALLRACVAHAIRAAKGTVTLADELVHHDEQVRIIARTAASPATTSGWASQVCGAAVADLFRILSPRSAAAALIARALGVSLEGVSTVSVPGTVATAAGAGSWIAEGSPLRVSQFDLSAMATITPFKLGTAVTMTAETALHSNAEAIIRALLIASASLALDQALFDPTQAAVPGLNPASLTNGVVPLAASTDAGVTGMATDIKTLIAALNGSDPVIIAAPGQAAALKFAAGANFDIPILPSSALAAGTVVGIEAPSLVFGFGTDPVIDASRDAILHMEDANPEPISESGTVPSPVRSLWQTDCIALRLIIRLGFALRSASHVQLLTGVAW